MRALDFESFNRVAEFVHLEARLADEHRYEDWFELWADELLYWIPATWAQDSEDVLSIIHENRVQLEDRIFRLNGRFNHSQTPKSLLLRVVSDIRVEPLADGWAVSSSFVLGEVRNEAQNTYFAKVHHELVELNHHLKIRKKIVRLLNADLPTPSMTFLI